MPPGSTFFSVACDVRQCISNLQLVGDYIASKWRLHWKEESKVVCSQHEVSVQGWSWDDKIEVLGSTIASDGSCVYDVDRACKAAWCRFWIGAGSRRFKSLPISMKLKDIHMCCLPSVSSRCYWCQCCATLSARVDGLHRRMFTRAVAVRPRSDEGWESFKLRRGRAVAKHMREISKPWSQIVAHRVDSWEKHIVRNKCGGWAGIAYKFMDYDWFYERRLFCGSKSGFGGRTRTRTQKGPPRTRFHDGVRFSREMLICA